jgi:UDP-N-acetylmuramate--alanine ligase
MPKGILINMFKNIKKIFFVGIGGIGMSGIAELLSKQGYIVSGSDTNQSDITDRLESLGIKVFIGHSEANVDNVDLVVYTSAVNSTNPEVAAAIKKNILAVKRSEMLAECIRKNYGICIAGTHGKTTTTAMVGLTLIEAGLDPTILVGGNLNALGGSNTKLGLGDFAVVEADEFDRTFLMLSPTIAVLNNLELEHLDTYSDLNDIKLSFSEFANKVPFYGFVLLCNDEPYLQEISPTIKRKTITYGIKQESDYQAFEIKHQAFNTAFKVRYKNKYIGELKLKIPGEHNVKNALAALAIANELGIEFNKVKTALESFSGVQRRFDIKYDKELMVVDDYAHHPTEVAATLKGIKKAWNRRLVTVFQPHLYSRTRDFYKDFAKAFLISDVFICTDVYAARENKIEGITGELITSELSSLGHKNFYYLQNKNDITNLLMEIKREDDIIILMGAGDIWKYGENFVNHLEKKNER